MAAGGGEGSLCQLGKAHTCNKHILQLADDTPSTCTSLHLAQSAAS